MGFLLTAEPVAAAGGGIVMILYIVVIVAFMYFIMIRPQKKEQKRVAAMLADMSVGDCVLTTSGFTGSSLILRMIRSLWSSAATRTAVYRCRSRRSHR